MKLTKARVPWIPLLFLAFCGYMLFTHVVLSNLLGIGGNNDDNGIKNSSKITEHHRLIIGIISSIHPGAVERRLAVRDSWLRLIPLKRR